MVAAQRFTTEQIVAMLREAEKMQAQGVTVPGISAEAVFQRIAQLVEGAAGCGEPDTPIAWGRIAAQMSAWRAGEG